MFSYWVDIPTHCHVHHTQPWNVCNNFWKVLCVLDVSSTLIMLMCCHHKCCPCVVTYWKKFIKAFPIWILMSLVLTFLLKDVCFSSFWINSYSTFTLIVTSMLKVYDFCLMFINVECEFRDRGSIPSVCQPDHGCWPWASWLI